MTSYTIVPALTKAHVGDYVRLFDQAFPGNGKLNEPYLDWLYNQNPDGLAVGADAFFGDELVAHYVTIPRRYRIGEHVVRALVSVNTATHPNHQRKGLFKRLANATYETATAQGISFVVGAANANSTHGFLNSLGFSLLGQIRMLAWCGARPSAETELSLDIRSDWLAWRLANPQACYRLSQASGDSVRVQTVQRGIGITLSIVPKALVPRTKIAPLVHRFSRFPSLTPIFPAPKGSVPLPDFLHPSPWNVIFRPLQEVDQQLDPAMLRYDGLAMDTF